MKVGLVQSIGLGRAKTQTGYSLITQRLAKTMPPMSLVLISSFAVQLATVFTKSLFETLGVIGTTFVCKAIASCLLLTTCQSYPRKHSCHSYWLIGLMGLAMAGMSLASYSAVNRIPLGVASALEFLGPLSVAILSSRQRIDFLWIALAATGIALFNPLHSATLDALGVGFALIAAACWASYIALSYRVGQVVSGKAGLALAMTVATLLIMPFGIRQAGEALFHPQILLFGLGVAILGRVIPYSLEFNALKQMSPRVFGVLISIEPAIAALVGLLFLNEVLAVRSVVAISLVTLATVGATISHNPVDF